MRSIGSHSTSRIEKEGKKERTGRGQSFMSLNNPNTINDFILEVLLLNMLMFLSLFEANILGKVQSY